jgi:hypothetical protein
VLKIDREYPFISIGLAYECQATEGLIPVDDYDQLLDFIVTEDNVYFNDRSKLVQGIFGSTVAQGKIQE